MKIPYYSKSQIEEYANALREKSIANGVDDIPCVELQDVVDFGLDGYQLCLEQEIDPPTEAYTCFSTNRIVVSLRAEANTARKRFTIAHEIGHILLHSAYMRSLALEGQIPLFEMPSSVVLQDARLEFQANHFASVFLLPQLKIIEFYNKSGESVLDAARLAGHFGVSRRSAEIRLEQLHLLLKAPPPPRLL